jgi:multicomponent Na+:H+ antiporter subunit F
VFAVATVAILVAMALVLARACLGPTVFDRILAVNTFGTKTVLLIAALGFLSGRPEFLDIVLVYALINFIGTVAVLKYVQYGDLALLSSGRDDRSAPEPGP